MTLIEILIVLGIVAALMAVGVPRMIKKNVNVKTYTRELSLLMREVRNQARMKDRTYRIRFELAAEGSKQEIWVEYADPQVRIQRKKAETSSEETSADPFQKDDRFTKEAEKVPPGLKIAQIELSGEESPTQAGPGASTAIYFSAEGLSDRAAIQVEAPRQVIWTIVLNPLTGHSEVFPKAVELDEL